MNTENLPEKVDGRNHGRIMCTQVRSDLGCVVDISGTGMRVRSKRGLGIQVGEPVRIALESAFGKIHLVVKLVWSRKVGLIGREHGISIEEVSPEDRAVLCQLAYACSQESFGLFHSLNTRSKAG